MRRYYKQNCITALAFVLAFMAFIVPMYQFDTLGAPLKTAIPCKNNAYLSYTKICNAGIAEPKADFFSTYKDGQGNREGLENKVVPLCNFNSFCYHFYRNVSSTSIFYMEVCSLLFLTIIIYILDKDGKKSL